MMRVRVTIASLLTTFVCTTSAASPWVLPRGTAVISTTFNHQFGDEEFFEAGRSRPFPLEGSYAASSFILSGRFGVSDRFEIAASLPVSLVSYQSDPVILLSREDGAVTDLDFYQENIIQLSQKKSGVGDLRVAGRYQLVRGRVAVSAEFGMKAPTGYDGPAGTFGDRPTSKEAFVADVARFVSPSNIRDDVTLGDAQLDLHGALLIGASLPSRTFFRMAAGYNLRLAGAGDQFLADFKAGQLLGQSWLLYAGARLAYSVNEGEVIGVSVAAVDPELPAEAYGGLTNLLLREVRLERDSLTVGGGTIFRITPEVELNVGVEHTLWGRNTARVTSTSLGLVVRTDLMAEPRR